MASNRLFFLFSAIAIAEILPRPRTNFLFPYEPPVFLNGSNTKFVINISPLKYTKLTIFTFSGTFNTWPIKIDWVKFSGFTSSVEILAMSSNRIIRILEHCGKYLNWNSFVLIYGTARKLNLLKETSVILRNNYHILMYDRYHVHYFCYTCIEIKFIRISKIQSKESNGDNVKDFDIVKILRQSWEANGHFHGGSVPVNYGPFDRHLVYR